MFPNLAALRALCPELPVTASPATVFAQDAVRRAVVAGLNKLADQGGGSSTRIVRVLLLEEPPSIDAGEITDKGYINQRAVLDRRAALVEGLHEGAAYLPSVTI